MNHPVRVPRASHDLDQQLSLTVQQSIDGTVGRREHDPGGRSLEFRQQTGDELTTLAVSDDHDAVPVDGDVSRQCSVRRLRIIDVGIHRQIVSHD